MINVLHVSCVPFVRGNYVIPGTQSIFFYLIVLSRDLSLKYRTRGSKGSYVTLRGCRGGGENYIHIRALPVGGYIPWSCTCCCRHTKNRSDLWVRDGFSVVPGYVCTGVLRSTAQTKVPGQKNKSIRRYNKQKHQIKFQNSKKNKILRPRPRANNSDISVSYIRGRTKYCLFFAGRGKKVSQTQSGRCCTVEGPGYYDTTGTRRTLPSVCVRHGIYSEALQKAKVFAFFYLS